MSTDPLKEAERIIREQQEWGMSRANVALLLLLQAVVSLAGRIAALEKRPKEPK